MPTPCSKNNFQHYKLNDGVCCAVLCCAVRAVRAELIVPLEQRTSFASPKQSKLAPSWVQVGSKLAPSWVQVGPKLGPSRVLNVWGVRRYVRNGPREGPRAPLGSKLRPSCVQVGPRTLFGALEQPIGAHAQAPLRQHRVSSAAQERPGAICKPCRHA